jgi:hypothetical protein
MARWLKEGISEAIADEADAGTPWECAQRGP